MYPRRQGLLLLLWTGKASSACAFFFFFLLLSHRLHSYTVHINTAVKRASSKSRWCKVSHLEPVSNSRREICCCYSSAVIMQHLCVCVRLPGFVNTHAQGHKKFLSSGRESPLHSCRRPLSADFYPLYECVWEYACVCLLYTLLGTPSHAWYYLISQ